MRSRCHRAAPGMLALFAFAGVSGAAHFARVPQNPPATTAREALLDQLPLSFEPIEAGSGRYLAHGLRGQVEISPAAVTFRKQQGKGMTRGLGSPSGVDRSPIRMRLSGTRANQAPLGAHPLPGKVNRLYGRNAKSWKTGIPTYAQVRQPEVFPGIDVVYYGNQKTLEYDFVVRPGADPAQIRLTFDAGSAPVTASVEASGDLAVAGGELRLHKPVVYQEAAGQRRLVESAYAVAANGDVSFHLGEYDHSRELVIDPQLTFSTYIGGSGLDAVSSIAADSAGSLYLTGFTNSPDFPHQSALQPANGGGFDAFVLKAVPSNGSYTLAYSTYIGGTGSESGNAIAVDASGYTYVYGVTGSADFPTENALGDQLNGDGSEGFLDAFLLKLTSTGSALVYSTYIGGSGDENVYGRGASLAVTDQGTAYIIGNTRSADFPASAGTYRESRLGDEDLFVGKLAADGQSGTATLIGAPSNMPEEALGIAVDPQGGIYICGDTQNGDYPTTAGAFRGTYSGDEDAFVTKLRPDLTGLVYSTYLGGTFIDQANAIGVDAAGFAYVAGFTGSADYPVTAAAYQGSFHGTAGSDRDATLTKLNQSGGGLVYSTFLGGASYDIATALQVDRLGAPCLGGFVDGSGFPVVNPTQATNAGGSDCFVTRFLNTGSALGFSTLLGGSQNDFLGWLALGADGSYYVVGTTYSTDFPQVSSPNNSRGDGAEGFLSRIADPQQSTAKAVVTPKSLNVGTVKAGAAKTKKVKIKNTGKSVLYGMVGLPAPPFTVGAGAGSFALAPKKSLSVEVRFAPTGTGTFTGTLPIATSDAAHAQINLALTGKGK